jgi:hypothetical protein
MKVSKRQLRRIIKEERARVISEQPVGPTGEEEKAAIEAEASRIGDEAFNTIFDLVLEMLTGSAGQVGDTDDVHPAVYKTVIQALKEVATDLEVEMKEVHPPEFITLWEPGYGPGGG